MAAEGIWYDADEEADNNPWIRDQRPNVPRPTNWGWQASTSTHRTRSAGTSSHRTVTTSTSSQWTGPSDTSRSDAAGSVLLRLMDIANRSPVLRASTEGAGTRNDEADVEYETQSQVLTTRIMSFYDSLAQQPQVTGPFRPPSTMRGLPHCSSTATISKLQFHIYNTSHISSAAQDWTYFKPGDQVFTTSIPPLTNRNSCFIRWATEENVCTPNDVPRAVHQFESQAKSLLLAFKWLHRPEYAPRVLRDIVKYDPIIVKFMEDVPKRIDTKTSRVQWFFYWLTDRAILGIPRSR